MKTKIDIVCVLCSVFCQRVQRAVCVLSATAVLALCATSCNVTRTVTTQSQYWQKGDTSVVIQTKTIETYDATKKI